MGRRWTGRTEGAEYEDGSVEDPVLRGLCLVQDLSDRELGLLEHLRLGAANHEIAHAVNISERTVRFHVSNLREKLGNVTRLQVCMIAALHHMRRFPVCTGHPHLACG